MARNFETSVCTTLQMSASHCLRFRVEVVIAESPGVVWLPGLDLDEQKDGRARSVSQWKSRALTSFGN